MQPVNVTPVFWSVKLEYEVWQRLYLTDRLHDSFGGIEL